MTPECLHSIMDPWVRGSSDDVGMSSLYHGSMGSQFYRWRRNVFTLSWIHGFTVLQMTPECLHSIIGSRFYRWRRNVFTLSWIHGFAVLQMTPECLHSIMDPWVRDSSDDAGMSSLYHGSIGSRFFRWRWNVFTLSWIHWFTVLQMTSECLHSIMDPWVRDSTDDAGMSSLYHGSMGSRFFRWRRNVFTLSWIHGFAVLQMTSECLHSIMDPWVHGSTDDTGMSSLYHWFTVLQMTSECLHSIMDPWVRGSTDDTGMSSLYHGSMGSRFFRWCRNVFTLSWIHWFTVLHMTLECLHSIMDPLVHGSTDDVGMSSLYHGSMGSRFYRWCWNVFTLSWIHGFAVLQMTPECLHSIMDPWVHGSSDDAGMSSLYHESMGSRFYRWCRNVFTLSWIHGFTVLQMTPECLHSIMDPWVHGSSDDAGMSSLYHESMGSRFYRWHRNVFTLSWIHGFAVLQMMPECLHSIMDPLVHGSTDDVGMSSLYHGSMGSRFFRWRRNVFSLSWIHGFAVLQMTPECLHSIMDPWVHGSSDDVGMSSLYHGSMGSRFYRWHRNVFTLSWIHGFTVLQMTSECLHSTMDPWFYRWRRNVFTLSWIHGFAVLQMTPECLHSTMDPWVHGSTDDVGMSSLYHGSMGSRFYRWHRNVFTLSWIHGFAVLQMTSECLHSTMDPWVHGSTDDVGMSSLYHGSMGSRFYRWRRNVFTLSWIHGFAVLQMTSECLHSIMDPWVRSSTDDVGMSSLYLDPWVRGSSDDAGMSSLYHGSIGSRFYRWRRNVFTLSWIHGFAVLQMTPECLHSIIGSRFYRWRRNVFTLSWIHGFAVLQMTSECLHSIMDPWVRGSTDDTGISSLYHWFTVLQMTSECLHSIMDPWVRGSTDDTGMSSLYHGSMGSRFYRWHRNVFTLSWIHGFAVLQMTSECLHSIMDPLVHGSTDDVGMSSLYHGSMGSRFFRWCRNVFTLSWIHGFAVLQMMPECLHSIMDPLVHGSTDDVGMSSLYPGSMGSRFFRWRRNVFTLSWIHGFAVLQMTSECLHSIMDPWVRGSTDDTGMSSLYHGSMGSRFFRWRRNVFTLSWIHGFTVLQMTSECLHSTMDPWVHGSTDDAGMSSLYHGSMGSRFYRWRRNVFTQPWIHGFTVLQMTSECLHSIMDPWVRGSTDDTGMSSLYHGSMGSRFYRWRRNVFTLSWIHWFTVLQMTSECLHSIMDPWVRGSSDDAGMSSLYHGSMGSRFFRWRWNVFTLSWIHGFAVLQMLLECLQSIMDPWVHGSSDDAWMSSFYHGSMGSRFYRCCWNVFTLSWIHGFAVLQMLLECLQSIMDPWVHGSSDDAWMSSLYHGSMGSRFFRCCWNVFTLSWIHGFAVLQMTPECLHSIMDPWVRGSTDDAGMSSLYHGSMGSRFFRWRWNVFTLSWIHGFAVLQMMLECLHSIMDPWVRGSTDDAGMSSLNHGSMGSRFFRWCRNVFTLSWIHGFAVLQMLPECLHSIMDPWVHGSSDDAGMSSLYHGSMGSRFYRWRRNVFTLSRIHGFAVLQMTPECLHSIMDPWVRGSTDDAGMSSLYHGSMGSRFYRWCRNVFTQSWIHGFTVLQMMPECLHSIMDPWVRGSSDDAGMSSLYHGSMGSRFFRWRRNVFTLSWIHGFAVLQMTLECLHSIMDPWVHGSSDDAGMSSLYHGSMGSRFYRWRRNVFTLSWIHGFAVLQMLLECLHSIMGSGFFRCCWNVFTLSWIHGFEVLQMLLECLHSIMDPWVRGSTYDAWMSSLYHGSMGSRFFRCCWNVFTLSWIHGSTDQWIICCEKND